MGKGDKRRPSFVSNEKYVDNYDRIFNGTEPETPVECTAIVKYTGAPWPTIKGPDLTKMDHPTACTYLVKGMEVKVLRRADKFENGWDNVWIPEMDECIGNVYMVETVETHRGIAFKEGGARFPAFCLQIIESKQENEECRTKK